MNGLCLFGFERNDKIMKNGKQLRILKEVVVDRLKAMNRKENRKEALIRLTVNPAVITCYLQKERGQRKKNDTVCYYGIFQNQATVAVVSFCDSAFQTS